MTLALARTPAETTGQRFAVADEHGLPALTMRRLGSQLGVEAMSLYRYVNGREDLLEAMVDQLVHELRKDDSVELPSDSWQAYLQWLAHSVRKIAVDHPHIFPLVATRNPAAPWLRPPLRSLEVVEDFLATLGSHGYDDEWCVAAYQLFSSFLLGFLLLEATQRSSALTLAEDQMDDDDDDSGPDDQLSDYPTIQRLAPLLAQDRAADEFEDALEIVLNRLETLHAAAS